MVLGDNLEPVHALPLCEPPLSVLKNLRHKYALQMNRQNLLLDMHLEFYSSSS